MFNVEDVNELQPNKQEAMRMRLFEKLDGLQKKGIFPFHGIPIIDMTDIVFPVHSCVIIELDTTSAINEPVHIEFKDAS